MAHDIAGDSRLDPRIKALLAAAPTMPSRDVDSREALLAEANAPEALRATEEFRQVMELCDTEELAPAKGLHVHTEQIVPSPTAISSTCRWSDRRPRTRWPVCTTSTAAG